MDFMGKKLEDIIVTLPMLYEVVEDDENNPIVMYIEDDIEYAIAAQHFANLLEKK